MPYFTMPKRSPPAPKKANSLLKNMSRLQSQISVLRQTHKRSPKRSSIPRSLTSLSDEGRYRLALSNPFHPAARGAKCTVFPYSNTQTQTIAWKAYVTVDTQNQPAVLILQANPSFYGWASGTGHTATNVTQSLGPMIQVGYGSVTGLNGALVDSQTSTLGVPLLSQNLMNYRVVAGGVKLRSVTQSNGSQIIGTMIPILTQNSDLAYSAVTGNAGDSGYATSLTVSSSDASNPNYWATATNIVGNGQAFVEKVIFGQVMTTNGSILTYPEVKNFSTYDILQRPLACRFLPISPEAFEFKDLGSANTTIDRPGTLTDTTVGDLATVTGTVSPMFTRRGNTDSAGFTGMYLTYNTCGITSAPASGAAIFELEYILHVEGTPAYGTNFGAFTGSTCKASSESSIITFARRMPSIMRVIEDGVNIASEVGMSISNIKSFLGQSNRYPRVEF